MFQFVSHYHVKASVQKKVQIKEFPLFSRSVENSARIVLVFSTLNTGLAIPCSKVTEEDHSTKITWLLIHR